jgi:hypothetical protein
VATYEEALNSRWGSARVNWNPLRTGEAQDTLLTRGLIVVRKKFLTRVLTGGP